MENFAVTFTSPGVAVLEEMPMPTPAAGQVLVENMVSTISAGTERANLIGDPTVSFMVNDPVAHFPRRIGYSSAGIVRAVGEGVTDLSPGDRVAVSGGIHQKYQALSAMVVHRLDDDSISFSDAAISRIATFPLAALRKTRLEGGESVLVMGQGVLGQLAVVLAHTLGAYPVIACDPDPSKRERALHLHDGKHCADYAVNPYDEDFPEQVKALTGGGVRVCVEVTGSGKGLDGALDCMRPFGRVALLGCTRHSDFTIDYYRKVHGPGITLVGAHTMARPTESAPGWWTERDDMRALLNWMKGGRLKLSSLVQETHPIAEAPMIFDRLAHEKVFPVVQLDWRV